MSAVRIQFMFLQQTAAGRRKITEAEQEQRAGSGNRGLYYYYYYYYYPFAYILKHDADVNAQTRSKISRRRLYLVTQQQTTANH